MHTKKTRIFVAICLIAVMMSPHAASLAAKTKATPKPKAPASLVGLGVIGKISIEGTRINNSVVVATDNVYYMDKNENGKKDANGAIFMDYRNRDISRRKNIILYGHNMKSGLMFADLHLLKTQKGLEKYKKVNLTLYGREYEYEIFRVVQVNISKDNYTRTQFKDNTEYSDFISKVNGLKAMASTSYSATSKDELLSLVTCVKGAFNDRIIAYARKVKDLGPAK